MPSRSVLHVSKTANGGRFIGFQIPHLVNSGVDVHLAVPGRGVLVDMAEEAGATVHIIPELGSRLPIRGVRKLGSLIDSVDADVVHTHFVHSTLLTRLARRVCGLEFVNLFQVPGPLHLEKTWSRLLDVRTASAFDEWGAACMWSRDRYLASGVPEARVHLTYYGKDLAAYELDSNAVGLDRSEFGFGSDDFIVTMVSHVYPPRGLSRRGIKGHEDFIDAIHLARQHEPSIRGLIVGGPRPKAAPYYRRLKSRSWKANGAAVQFSGPRSDVPDIYRISDAAVHPSLSENIGGAGESLLMGVPTISTNIGGFPDVVISGETGRMVEPRSPQALASAILSTLRDIDISRTEAQRGHKRMLTIGSARLNAERVVEIYRKLGVLV